MCNSTMINFVGDFLEDKLDTCVKHRFYQLSIDHDFQYPILYSMFKKELSNTRKSNKDYVNSYNIVKDWALKNYYCVDDCYSKK